MKKKYQFPTLILMIFFLSFFFKNSSLVVYRDILGSYKGTYSFNEEIGMKGKDISWINYVYSDSNDPYVISEKDGHQEVLEVSSNTEKQTVFETESLNKEKGTIEWWWRAGQEDKQHRLAIYGIDSNIIIWIGFDVNGMISVYNGTIQKYVINYNSNKWYHWRLDFDCKSNFFNLFIDKKLVAENFIFYRGSGDINSGKMLFYTDEKDYKFWIDSVGYSWEDEYEIGDNLELKDELDPITYLTYFLLAGTLVFTIIIGINPRISLPFILRLLVEKNIIKKRIYFKILNFIFLIFRRKDFIDNKKWDIYEATKTSIEIIPEFAGKKNVFKMYDNSDLGKVFIRNHIISPNKNITIEWDWLISNKDKTISFSLINSDLYRVESIKIKDGYIFFWDGIQDKKLQVIKSNEWYKMKIEFKTNISKIYVNGLKKANQVNFLNPSNSVEFLQFYTDNFQHGYYACISGVRYN